ncbi:hypothetical protein BDN71DRAFT_222661 [Pleurotus eryngii]|uniref:Uncharacterized protein n=1 Tax=Pleurotus eryngii TaxID=5323 RepID=A0A9P5ZMJ8_PLEER|nr:hypothetical protein BDN71DRAFT_222661 [Pleurotus eryngii]
MLLLYLPFSIRFLSIMVSRTRHSSRELATPVANLPHQSQTRHINCELATSVANFPRQVRSRGPVLPPDNRARSLAGYYQRNQDTLREKARLRMAKLRAANTLKSVEMHNNATRHS